MTPRRSPIDVRRHRGEDACTEEDCDNLAAWEVTVRVVITQGVRYTRLPVCEEHVPERVRDET